MKLTAKAKYWIYNFCPGLAGRFPYFETGVYFPVGATIFRAACEQGIFEADIVNLLVRLVRPQGIVFDVGANIGLMAIPVLYSCQTCRVISFEPSPNSLPFIQRTARESNYRNRWTIVEKALSREPGKLDFAIGRPQDALFEGFKSAARLSHGRVIKVPVSTLDIEWRHLGSPEVSVVKIDVEGAEGSVLDGGTEMIDACHPSLLIEWHERYLADFQTPVDQLLLFARRFGYQIYTVPAGIPIDGTLTLRIQMMTCSNFLLVR